MAWDSSLPADDSKIRNLGTEIRPNWQSIEQGEDANPMASTASYLQQYSSAYIERNGRAANLDPTTESETFYVYCRQDTNGVAEGHVKDPAGNVIAMTEAGKLGNRATDIYLNSFAFDTNAARVNDENNIVVAWGSFDNTGALLYGSGFVNDPTVSDTSLYTLKLTTNRVANANYVPVVMGGDNVAFLGTGTLTTTTFQIRGRSVSDGAKKAGSFFAVVFGGQS